MEVVADGGGTLSIVLVGHPKLRNDLRRPTMEEIGYRATVFSFDGIAGSQREYIDWLLRTCAAEETKPAELIDDAATDLLAAKLRTPLQIEQHLALAFEEAFRVGEKPVTVEVVEAVLSRQIDDLEPKLMCHGYDVGILASQFNAKPAEIRQFLRGALDPPAPGSSPIRCWRPACRCSRRAASDRLTECGSVPLILGWSHQMWVPSQIMRAEVRPQSQLIWAGIRDDLAPRLR